VIHVVPWMRYHETHSQVPASREFAFEAFYGSTVQLRVRRRQVDEIRIMGYGDRDAGACANGPRTNWDAAHAPGGGNMGAEEGDTTL
jgi:hypothetical protein